MTFLDQKKHFLDISQLDISDINGLLSKAIFFAQNPPIIKKFQGRKALFYFKEPSTRTSLSFQIAARNLGLETFMIEEKSSSFTKGENFEDALRVFEAMGVETLVMRSQDEQEIFEAQDKTKIRLINAGAGCRHHPSQALLDLACIHENTRKTQGLTIAIVGDTTHSRVTHSHQDLHRILGNEVILCSDDLSDDQRRDCWEEIYKKADILMMLRVQKERHQEQKDLSHYLQNWGLNSDRIKQLKKDTLVLHPGPFNRGVEICETLLDHPQVKILDQVKWGVPTRMAIFDYVLGGLS